MDTKKDSAVSDVPTFKVARVGKDRKKGGGLSFLRGGGARGSFSGAAGGAGSGAGAAGLSKAILGIMLASGITAASMYAGYLGASGEKAPVKKPAIFADSKDIKIEGDTSNLPSNANTIPNSMGYVSGSADGLTPEERAKKAAEAAEAQRLADEEAKKAEQAEKDAQAKGNAAVDPAALLASAKGDGGKEKGNAFGKKFGSLSSSMGGGSALAGGAGMAGGVGRSFGGMGSISKGGKGQLSGAVGQARPGMSKAGSGKMASSKVKGFARKQLGNANALSRRGSSASKGETSAYDAASAFDNNQGAGTIISGAGITPGSKAAGDSDGSANPNTTSNPISTPVVECGKDEYQAADGKCKPIKKEDGKKDDPNAWMYDAAQGILIAVTALTALWYVAAGMSWAGGATIMQACAYAILGLSLALTALGLAMIMTTGDKMAGGIFTAVGALMSYMAYYGTATSAAGMALKVIVPAILGGFAGAMAHKPDAASQ